jgi:hypothetical protein
VEGAFPESDDDLPPVFPYVSREGMVTTSADWGARSYVIHVARQD